MSKFVAPNLDNFFAKIPEEVLKQVKELDTKELLRWRFLCIHWNSTNEHQDIEPLQNFTRMRSQTTSYNAWESSLLLEFRSLYHFVSEELTKRKFRVLQKEWASLQGPED